MSAHLRLSIYKIQTSKDINILSSKSQIIIFKTQSQLHVSAHTKPSSSYTQSYI